MQLFYLPELINSISQLDEIESRHLKVLRKKSGDIIHVADGKGHYAEARISGFEKKNALLEILEIHSVKKDKPTLSLLVSPLKNADRFEWMLEKCTEIGVETIIPLMCERTESPLRKIERLERIIRSACMQSKQFYIPELKKPIYFKELHTLNATPLKLIAWCEGKDRLSLPESLNSGQDATILIGPEGDFTQEEFELAHALGYQAISLGQNRLRTETAAVFATTAFKLENI